MSTILGTKKINLRVIRQVFCCMKGHHRIIFSNNDGCLSLKILNHSFIYFIHAKEIFNIIKFHVRHNIVGICDEKKIYDEKNFENILSEKILILNHFQDTNNLGAVVRSAAAFDFQTIFLPKKRSVQITEKTFAISSGGMEYVNIVMYNSIFSLIKKIKNLGYWTIGLDMNSSNQIKDLDLKNQNIGLIVGSEETGLSKEIQKKLDLIVDISMTKNMESLNASVATAIAMHEIFIKK